MKLRKLAGCAAFLVVLFFCLTGAERALREKNPEMLTADYYKAASGKHDIIFLGPSTIMNGVYPLLLWKTEGFAAYNLGSGNQGPWWSYCVAEEVIRREHPKLIVVDVFGGGYDLDLVESRNSQVYTIMTHTPLSREKIETAKELSSKIDRTTTASLLLPFIKYHNSVPANLMDLKDRLDVASSGPSPLKGIETLTRTRELADVDDISFTDETAPLDEKTEAVINEFMDYCKSKDLNVLFVKYPTVLTKNDPDELQVNLRANRILEMADEAGFHTLNMQKHFHEIGLKEREDYYNHGHTNTRGQKKVTGFLGDYIQNELGIAPSDLSDSLRTEWDDSVRYYGAYVEMSEELINKGDPQPMGDSPKLVRELKKRLD